MQIDYNVPVGIDSNWLRSWRLQNPKMIHMFWSEDDVRCFLYREYRWLLPTYNAYSMGKNNGGIYRGDAMRYPILHYFGGWYADLDIECLRPFGDISQERCIVPENHIYHTMIWKKSRPDLVNSIMGSESNYTFWPLVISEMMARLKRDPYNDNVLEMTGPFLLSDVYNKHRDELDDLLIASYKEFSPLTDPANDAKIQNFCKKKHIDRDYREMCENVIHKQQTATAYVNHHWTHMYVNDKFTNYQTTSVFEIIPGVQTYQSMFGKCSTDEIARAKSLSMQLPSRVTARASIPVRTKRKLNTSKTSPLTEPVNIARATPITTSIVYAEMKNQLKHRSIRHLQRRKPIANDAEEE